MGFAAIQTLVGVTQLSELGIDIGKNWLTYLIKNLGDPVAAQDAATKKYVDDNIGGITKLSELTIDVSKDWLGYLIKNLGAPVADNDAARKKYVDDRTWSLTQTEPARVLGTEYRNTGSTPIIVTVSAYCYVSSDTGSFNGGSWIGAYVKSTSPANNLVTIAGINSGLNGLAVTDNWIFKWVSVTFVVPPNYYYKVAANSWGNGTDPTLEEWFEWI